MQLDNNRREFSPTALRWSSARCPLCHERVVAPEMSEFVDSGQIRHHWACDGCGSVFSTAIETKALVGRTRRLAGGVRILGCHSAF